MFGVYFYPFKRKKEQEMTIPSYKQKQYEIKKNI